MDVDLARSLYITLVNVGCAYVYNGFRAADMGIYTGFMDQQMLLLDEFILGSNCISNKSQHVSAFA